jgi:outer membrane protein assembly factor BamB
VATNRGRLEGEVGQQPEQVPHEYQAAGADWPAFSFDWVARQVSVLPLADRMLVSNRFQLASYDVANGQLQWRAGLGGDQATTHSWRLAPARPVATAKLAYVRRFKAAGPVLAAIELATGQVAWETSLSGEHWVVSDPVVTQGSLYAISARHAEWGYIMSLLTIDLQTGVVLRERPLVSFRESWWQLGDCQVLAVDERLFVVSGGAVISCDLMGNVLWVRRQLLLPQAVDAFWCQQAQLPPLLHDGKVLVVQPGVPGVAAFDAKNGQRLWQAKLPTPRRVLGVVEDRLLVDTSHGMRGLDVANGNRVWQYASPNLLDAFLLAEKGGAIVAERQPVPDKPEARVRLVWLDPTTGKLQHQVELDQPAHPQVYFGPMWIAGKRLWALSGQGVQDPNRNLVELTPK